ncbi:MAG: hypothetical protein Ta2F_17860 [Termitinemataceae bacterium]|nr:MAG: hypothetical protein Ta2F_17860 [Termitinemataceae bacterium]
MSVNKGQLRECEDFQQLIIEHLTIDNGYALRSCNQHYNTKYAMDTELLFSFFEATQPDVMEKLKKIYTE